LTAVTLDWEDRRNMRLLIAFEKKPAPASERIDTTDESFEMAPSNGVGDSRYPQEK
jgi:hypothetical protein